MRKFKVGDKVKIISKTSCDSSHNKDIGRIYSIGEIYGDGSGRDEDNCIVVNGNFYTPRDLKLINNNKQMKKATYGIKYERDEDPVEFFDTKTQAEKRIKELLLDNNVDKESLYLFHIDKKWKINQPVKYDLVDLK